MKPFIDCQPVVRKMTENSNSCTIQVMYDDIVFEGREERERDRKRERERKGERERKRDKIEREREKDRKSTRLNSSHRL